MASVPLYYLTSIIEILFWKYQSRDSIPGGWKTPWKSQKNLVHGVPLMSQIREPELYAVQILLHIIISLVPSAFSLYAFL